MRGQGGRGGLPSNRSCRPQGARGSAAGRVRRCARGGWLKIPGGFLPGQTRLHSPVDCPLRGTPRAALTLAHCSSQRQLCGSYSPALPPATPAEPRLVCTCPADPWGSVLPPRGTPTESGCSTSAFLRTFLQTGTKTECCGKTIRQPKMFN